MLNNVAGSVELTVASPKHFTHLSHELRLNLVSYVKSPGCQFWCAPWCQAVSTGPTAGHQATFMKSVSKGLLTNIHASGLLEVNL